MFGILKRLFTIIKNLVSNFDFNVNRRINSSDKNQLYIFYVANSNDFIANYNRNEKKHFDLHSGRASTKFNKRFY